MVQIIPIILVLAIYIVIPITLGWYLFLKNKASIPEKWIWMNYHSDYKLYRCIGILYLC